MSVKIKFDKDFAKKLHLIFYEALDRSYVRDIINNTPVDTGVTRNLWEFFPTGMFEYELVNRNGGVVLYLELGTGIYGKRKSYITPVRKKALRWYDRKLKRYVFAKKVKGIKPRHFILRCLQEKSNYNKFINIIQDRLRGLKNEFR